jgi:hypothetical protein
MSNALATIPTGGALQIGGDDIYAELAKGSDYIKSMKLYTKGKAIDKGQIGPGRYGVYEGKDDITDLGTSIDLLVFARRPFAIDMSDLENIVRCYDTSDPVFAEIRAKSGEQNSGCQSGVDLLVFERSTASFYSWFAGSKSTLKAASELFGYMPIPQEVADAKGIESRGPLPVTCKVKLVEGRFTYHVPVVQKCSTPFTNLPAESVIVDALTKFLNPRTDQVESAEEGEIAGRAR